jgi:hypothetical protein
MFHPREILFRASGGRLPGFDLGAAPCVVFLALVSLAGGPGVAVARDADLPPPPVSADDVRDAPLPDEAHGVAVSRPDPSRSILWVPRTLLLIPRTLLDVAFKPLQLGADLWDRWQLSDRFRRAFFNDDETFGVYPVASIDLDLGLSAGIHAQVRNALGRGGSLDIEASYGHPLRQNYGLEASTGRLLGDRIRLELDVDVRVAPSERFYGIGNGDNLPVDKREQPFGDPDPLRPLRVATIRGNAVSTRYSRQHVSGTLRVPARLRPDLEISTAVGASRERPGAPYGGDDLDTGVVFAPDTLTGYRGYSMLHGAFALRFDNRVSLGEGRPAAALKSGWFVEGAVSYSLPLEGEVGHFLRYTADAQVLLDILRGMRILLLRLRIEGIAGDLDRVPFIELPRMGGPHVLRGYDRDRFRDRLAVLGSLEYRWEFHQRAQAFLFLDTGRVFAGPLDFRFRDFRLGYGAGVHIFGESAFGVRAQVASSIDGGVYLNVVFSPGPGVPDLGWN